MRVKCAMGLWLMVAAQVFGQTVTTLNLSTQGHNPDFASFPFTRPISTGPAVPATCQLGQMFFNTAAAPGQNIYACTQTNTWTLLGAFTLVPAGPSTLGGVLVSGNSALSIGNDGLLSANVGTGAGTLAAGNDTRIVNALQPTSQIPATNVIGLARSATTDTTSASNISTGTLNVTLLPSTINSNTTGNAATASSLAVVPKGCNTGQFSVGISGTGTSNCAQVAYTQLSNTPSLNNQTVQVSGGTQQQRPTLNFVAGSNLTITPADNGLNTTTLTISGTGLQAPSTTNKLLKYTTGSSTTAAQASDVTSALGFTPQNVVGLNAPSGYAGLDATGLLLATEMPPAISSNTSGKAATATALAALPLACSGGQFATGIGANGNAICGTPTGTSGLPDPGTNGLVKRTGANADAVAAAGVDYYAPGTQINDLDLPNTITSSITGNASTATALAAAPTACAAGQVLAQILPNGNPGTCVPSNYNTLLVNSTSQTQRAKLAVNAGSNITITSADNGSDTTTLTIGATGGTGSGLADPGANGLVKRTASNTTTAAIAGTDYYAPGATIASTDLPATIAANTTGNASTATALKVAPSGCAGGQFVTQISANGTPACGVAASGGPSITSGTTVPTVPGCSALTKGAGYLQTGIAGGSSGSALYICSTGPAGFNGGYAWVPQSGHHVNVMAFGARADGSTDDSAAFQTAINFASTLNRYTQYDGTNPYLGADVYVPCGAYGIANPIVLPRVGTGSFSNGPNNGVVGLVGESSTCSILQGIAGSGFYGVTGVMVTNTGSGYTSAPSISFSGGCTTEPGAASLIMGHTTNVADIYITTPASGCTSQPTCTVSGGGGSGATCITVGRAMIEWADITTGFIRTFGQKIMNLGFYPPKTAGAMGIHFTLGSNTTPQDPTCTIGGGTVCDRMEQALFENLHAEDDNVYHPAFIYFGADCNTCILHNVTNDPAHQATAVYQTVLIATNLWAQAISGEGEGLQYGKIDTIGCGDSKGGSAPCFQGRLQRTTMSNTFCDGIRAPVGNQTCYAFYNSSNVKLDNIGNDGDSGQQILLQNSRNFVGEVIGVGSPTVTGVTQPLGGLYLINSSNNRFTGHTAGQSYANSYPGTYSLLVDSTSYQNEFFDWQIQGTNDVVMSNPTNNFMQYCLAGSCGTNSAWLTMGTAPF
jgi:hypothetical protein